MTGIEKEIRRRKSKQSGEQRGKEALRVRRTTESERLSHYVGKERSELRKLDKLATALKARGQN